MSSSWMEDIPNQTATSEMVNDEASRVTEGHTAVEWTLISVKLIVGVFGTIGNLFVCVLVGQMKAQKVKFLIRSQSTIDLFASILIVADTVTTEIQSEPPPPHQHPVPGQLYCMLYAYQMLLFGLFAASSYNLVAISIERYITVFHPFWYRINFTQKKTYILGATAWILGPVMQVVYSSYGANYKDGKCVWIRPSAATRCRLSLFMFLWEFFIPCLLMAFFFIRISLKLRKYDSNKAILQNKYSASRSTTATSTVSQSVSSKDQNFVNKESSPTGSISLVSTTGIKENTDTTVATKKEANEQSRSRKVTRTFIFVFLAYVCCWSTNQTLLLQYNCGGYRHFGTAEYHFANSMAILNCAINPFIYVLHLKQYQNELKSFFNIK